MTTQDSQSKYDERESLSIKIAKQIFPILHPYGVKRTQGEKNEDAHYIEQQVYHENIMKYIDDYVTTRVKEAELQARIDELSSVYIYHPQHAQGTLKTDRPMGEVTVQERLNELVSELKQELEKL